MLLGFTGHDRVRTGFLVDGGVPAVAGERPAGRGTVRRFVPPQRAPLEPAGRRPSLRRATPHGRPVAPPHGRSVIQHFFIRHIGFLSFYHMISITSAATFPVAKRDGRVWTTF